MPTRTTRRRWHRRWRALPRWLQGCLVLLAVGLLWLASNGIYQVFRKPTELFFPISGVLRKHPAETWRVYGPLFRRHSTEVMTPDLLAALAQVEGAGDPLARTYWRWKLDLNPFSIYRPASSSVGMYQITDGTFAQARRYCIHDHVVVEQGAWNDWDACWFNGLYTRVIPSHAIELTSAYLSHRVSRALARHPVPGVSLQSRQALAAVIHLCGASAGVRLARQGLRIEPGRRCGTHDLRSYLDKIERHRARFRQLAAQEP
jgi:hypothetical protein